jgi:hypothetical protein
VLFEESNLEGFVKADELSDSPEELSDVLRSMLVALREAFCRRSGGCDEDDSWGPLYKSSLDGNIDGVDVENP